MLLATEIEIGVRPIPELAAELGLFPEEVVPYGASLRRSS
jgi:hypothetical protein